MVGESDKGLFLHNNPLFTGSDHFLAASIKEMCLCCRTQTPAAPRSPAEAHSRETLKLHGEATPAGSSTSGSLPLSAGEGTCGSKY